MNWYQNNNIFIIYFLYFFIHFIFIFDLIKLCRIFRVLYMLCVMFGHVSLNQFYLRKKFLIWCYLEVRERFHIFWNYQKVLLFNLENIGIWFQFCKNYFICQLSSKQFPPITSYQLSYSILLNCIIQFSTLYKQFLDYWYV